MSKDLDLDIADVKQCLLSLIYGATESPWYKAAIPKAIGAGKAFELYEHPLFKAVSGEVETVGKVVIENAEVKRCKAGNTVISAMGKAINAKEDPKAILAHLLQSIEARMLQSVVELYVEEILLLQHDGWTAARQLDMKAIEDEIEQETGFKMVVEEALLEPWK